MPSTVNRRPTGAKPSPRHKLAAASPHRVVGTTPSQWIVIPQKLSYWLNNVDGICVTAEEAFAKACSGIFISDSVVEGWASARGVLNGADLSEVLGWMTTDGFHQDGGNVYNDGTALSVDWTNTTLLQNAIYQGPVKIAVAADQLQNVVGTANGWFATHFQHDQNLDHCVSLCGFGPLAWLVQQFGGVVPAGIDGRSLGYAMFTWNTIGIIDLPSMLAITGEAWLRNPTTVIIGSHVPTPDPVTIPVPVPTPGVSLSLTDQVLPGPIIVQSGSGRHRLLTHGVAPQGLPAGTHTVSLGKASVADLEAKYSPEEMSLLLELLSRLAKK